MALNNTLFIEINKFSIDDVQNFYTATIFRLSKVRISTSPRFISFLFIYLKCLSKYFLT